MAIAGTGMAAAQRSDGCDLASLTAWPAWKRCGFVLLLTRRGRSGALTTGSESLGRYACAKSAQVLLAALSAKATKKCASGSKALGSRRDIFKIRYYLSNLRRVQTEAAQRSP